MTEHLNNFQGLINQVATLNVNLDDEVQVLLLCSSLMDSWETMVIIVNNSGSNSVLTMNTTNETVMNEELKRKE